MSDTVKAGVATSEFFVIVALCFIAVVSGFSMTNGVPDYHANMDLMSQLFYAGMTYIGGRTGLKVAEVIKKPAQPALPPEPVEPPKVPTAEEVATQVLAKLQPVKGNP